METIVYVLLGCLIGIILLGIFYFLFGNKTPVVNKKINSVEFLNQKIEDPIVETVVKDDIILDEFSIKKDVNTKKNNTVKITSYDDEGVDYSRVVYYIICFCIVLGGIIYVYVSLKDTSIITPTVSISTNVTNVLEAEQVVNTISTIIPIFVIFMIGSYAMKVFSRIGV